MHQKSKESFVLDYLEKLNEFRFSFSLYRIKKALRLLKNPQNNFYVIHITGTNGKGSTALYLTNIFKYNKIKVGTYLSPHIIDIRERILINSKKINKKIFFNTAYELIKFLNKKNIKLTYFEFLTTLAFIIFKKEKVKIAIIEVGLGGRFDATNVCYKKKLLNIITSVSKDHTNYLGNTLLNILKEKEQIIKRNTLTVVNIKQKRLIDYLKKRREKIIFADEVYKTKNILLAKNGLEIKYEKKGKEILIKTKMLEIIQSENIKTVLCSSDILKEKFNLQDYLIKKAIKNTVIEGRLTKTKNYFISVAHNKEGIFNSLYTLEKLFPDKKIIYIFSLLKDKDINDIFKIISKYKDRVILILTEIKNERGVDVEKLKRYAIKYRIKHYIKNLPETLNFAQKIRSNGIILIGGSFYLVKNFS